MLTSCASPASETRPSFTTANERPFASSSCTIVRWVAVRRCTSQATGSPGAVLAGQLEQAMRGLLILTYGGGTNELQRDIIASFGLGMPRPDP